MPAWTPYPQLKIIVLLIVMLATVSAGATYAVKKLSQPQPPHQFESLPTFKIQPELWPLTESEQLDIGSIEAKSVILINEDSGQIVAQRQADTKLPIASTTKIMTAALALEFLDPQSTITIPDNIFEDLPPDSALMGISPGEVYTLEELLYGLMLNSGNDAANAIALAVSGSQSDFVNLMNAKAAQLGLTSTNFANPSGLDHPNHYSTARELAIIAHYARSFPIFKEIVKSPSRTIPYTGNHKYLELTNLNPLLTIYPGTTGIKPGNTGEAGNCLVASVNRDGVRYIGVLLDTPGRNTNMAALFDLAYATQP